VEHSTQCQDRARRRIGGCWCADPIVQANIAAERRADADRAAAALRQRRRDWRTMRRAVERAYVPMESKPSWGERGPQTEAEYDR
jgi:hypothetical protein